MLVAGWLDVILTGAPAASQVALCAARKLFLKLLAVGDRKLLRLLFARTAQLDHFGTRKVDQFGTQIQQKVYETALRGSFWERRPTPTPILVQHNFTFGWAQRAAPLEWHLPLLHLTLGLFTKSLLHLSGTFLV